MTIINTWDQMAAAGGDRVFICYQQQSSRALACAGYHVRHYINRKEVPTDPEAAWYDHGAKFFMCGLRAGLKGHAARKAALAEAIAWADEHLGPRKYVRNRLGNYVEEEVNKLFPLTGRPREGAG